MTHITQGKGRKRINPQRKVEMIPFQAFQHCWLLLLSSQLSGASREEGLLETLPLLLVPGNSFTEHSLRGMLFQMTGSQGLILL